MSNRYRGGYITASPPSISSSAAKGVWTISQAMKNKSDGNWPTYVEPTYIEDVFSITQYKGAGGTQNVTYRVETTDVAGLYNNGSPGGLVIIRNLDTHSNGANGTFFIKPQTSGGSKIALADSSAASGYSSGEFQVNSNGTIKMANGELNGGTGTPRWVMQCFARASRFMDVVEYTGDGAASKSINHSLNSEVGFMIITQTSGSGGNRIAWHRSAPANNYWLLNSTSASISTSTNFIFSNPTTTQFTVGTSLNTSSATYRAFLFAHDETADGIIYCGKATTDGAGAIGTSGYLDIGWEPQWMLWKPNSASDTTFYDAERGWGQGDGLGPYSIFTSGATGTATEGTHGSSRGIWAKGLHITGQASSTDHYFVAIRRGPMRQPTAGTQVLSINAYTGTGSGTNQEVTTGFPMDSVLYARRNQAGGSNFYWFVKKASTGRYMNTNSNGAETNMGGGNGMFIDGVPGGGLTITSHRVGGDANNSSYNFINYAFRRYPGVYDIVNYVGNGSARVLNHNLGAKPELVIVKKRTAASAIGWIVSSYHYYVSTRWDRQGRLNLSNGLGGGGIFGSDSDFTSTTFPVDTYQDVNENGTAFFAHLFATKAGVSKVGAYTGTGTTLNVDCGFSAGARWVMIKETDETQTNKWYVWDTARGIVSGNDPFMSFESNAAETTGTDYIDPYNPGFTISSTAASDINTNGRTYIFLAFA